MENRGDERGNGERRLCQGGEIRIRIKIKIKRGRHG
jgi:hypothetical protein